MRRENIKIVEEGKNKKRMRRENNKIEEEGIQEWGGGGERLKLWRRE